jgi:hypothetical protein
MNDANSGWLYRQSDLVLGPVPAKQIIDKLYSGELNPGSDVQLMGSGTFVRLADVTEFKVHVAKAEAKRRVDAHAAEHHAQQRSRLVKTAWVVGAALLVIGIGVVVAGNYYAVHGGKSAEELAWGDITIDAPTISKARRTADDDLVDYHAGGTKKPPTNPAQPAVARNDPTPKNPAGNTPPPTSNGKPKPGSEDPDGMAMGEVDEAAINQVVSRNKPTLIHCIKDVAKPGMPATKIPIEFAVSEAGKVTKVWVDNPEFKDSPLQDCLLKELQKWQFKAGPSGASVNLSFNIGKRG